MPVTKALCLFSDPLIIAGTLAGKAAAMCLALFIEPPSFTTKYHGCLYISSPLKAMLTSTSGQEA